LEVLECLPVVPTSCDHRSEDGREGVSGDAEPVGPGPVLACFVDDRFANVKEHSLYGSHFALRSRRTVSAQCQLSVEAPSERAGAGLVAETAGRAAGASRCYDVDWVGPGSGSKRSRGCPDG